MTAKIIKSPSFSRLINYMLNDKKNAKIIAIKDVNPFDKNMMIADFEMQAKMNNRVSKKIGHTSLNFMEEDTPLLSNELMAKIAKEYLTEMGIVNTQFVVVPHFDKKHWHCHICYNRINNQGKTISDSNDRVRSTEICKRLTKKYGLNFSKGKVNVNRERLRGKDKVKYEIYDAIRECLPKSKN
ncbi:MAG: relaxase/mobilization nuclease domain-containing protein, partial [Bacteroidales bacterium]|nr:relaxase/mobilization nuclease domain-containing protein [Bacteroidales bacterium]